MRALRELCAVGTDEDLIEAARAIAQEQHERAAGRVGPPRLKGPQGPSLPERPTREDILRRALWRAAEMLIDAGEHPAAARFFVSDPNGGKRQTTDPAELALYLERTAEPE